MTKSIDFRTMSADQASGFGFCYSALQHIFLGPPNSVEPNLGHDCPPSIRSFLQREFKASEISFAAIGAGNMSIPGPYTGGACACSSSFIPVQISDGVTVICKLFEDCGVEFALVFSTLNARVTHLVIPHVDWVVYDMHPDFVASSLQAITQFASSRTSRPKAVSCSAVRIGLMDMVTNFAHQAMNYLAGIQRLIDDGFLSCLDEIWLCGIEFFGPTELLFPELAGMIRRVSRQEVISALGSSENFIYKIGSNIINDNLRQRIISYSLTKYPVSGRGNSKFPVICVTVRAQGRRCLNLVDMVGNVVRELKPKYPDLSIVFDGWVIPEGSADPRIGLTTSSKILASQLNSEIELCEQASRVLPSDVSKTTLIGKTLLESIAALSSVDAYIAHIGTLQHKLGWFTSAPGVVHGPRSELAFLQAGTYAISSTVTPVMLTPDDVTDLAVENTRGATLNDYNVDNIQKLVTCVDKFLSSMGSEQASVFYSLNKPMRNSP